jgi:hypothetical protein
MEFGSFSSRVESEQSTQNEALSALAERVAKLEELMSKLKPAA